MTRLTKAIIKTLCFFAIFSRPLTLEELWQFLYKTKASKLQVLLALQKMQAKKIIIKKKAYFALAINKNIFRIFGENRLICHANWRKVTWVVKILRFTPFVKNISIINSLSFGTSHKNSDIDILIIAKKNRLWTARAFVVFLLELIGQNKNKWQIAGKFCLGFAFDEKRLNLEKIQLQKYIYSPYWLANLTPVFDRRIYKNLIIENQWLKQELPNWLPKKVDRVSTKLSIVEKFLNSRIGDRLENWLANIQIKRVWADPENIRGKKGSVIASGSMLKMHPYDKRPEYQSKFRNFYLQSGA